MAALQRAESAGVDAGYLQLGIDVSATGVACYCMLLLLVCCVLPQAHGSGTVTCTPGGPVRGFSLDCLLILAANCKADHAEDDILQTLQQRVIALQMLSCLKLVKDLLSSA